MLIATSPQLDETQGQALSAGFDFAWRRLLRADGLLNPAQHAQVQNILTSYLLRLVRRGERDAQRLARRGIFFVCGVLACPEPVGYVGRSLRLADDDAEIVF